MKKNVFALFFALILSACSFKQEAATEHILRPKAPQNTFATSAKSIKINPTQAPLYLNDARISYIQDDEIAAYAKHSFHQPPSTMVHNALVYKFEQSKAFSAVLELNSAVDTEYSLDTRLDSFVQIFTNEQDSFVQMRLSVSLLKGRELITQQYFSCEIPVKAFGVKPSIATFDEALNKIGDEVLLWAVHEISSR